MKTERIDFEGHVGLKLAARMDRPDTEPRAVALFAHCFTCSKDIAAARMIAAALARIGIAVLRFDFTGLGNSEGEFSNTNFSCNVEDLVQAAEHLKSMGMPPSMLIGHSLGGAAVLVAASRIESARAVVTIGAPAHPSHVSHHFSDRLDEIRSKGEAEVSLGGRKFVIKQQFVEDIDGARMASAISELRKALLVMHAPFDTTVGIENAADIFTKAKHPKSFVSLNDANHLITRKSDAEYAANVIAAWSRNYLPHSTASDSVGLVEGRVRVSEVDPTGFRQAIVTSDNHRMVADEPVGFGGTNEGPSPYGFLAAGLGACTSMTIRLYARRKGWKLQSVFVDVEHDHVHASDCEACETSQVRIDRFTRVIHLQGDLTDEQRSRLLGIADKCPVHRTLHAASKIETRLASED